MCLNDTPYQLYGGEGGGRGWGGYDIPLSVYYNCLPSFYVILYYLSQIQSFTPEMMVPRGPSVTGMTLRSRDNGPVSVMKSVIFYVP